MWFTIKHLLDLTTFIFYATSQQEKASNAPISIHSTFYIINIYWLCVHKKYNTCLQQTLLLKLDSFKIFFLFYMFHTFFYCKVKKRMLPEQNVANMHTYNLTYKLALIHFLRMFFPLCFLKYLFSFYETNCV